MKKYTYKELMEKSRKLSIAGKHPFLVQFIRMSKGVRFVVMIELDPSADVQNTYTQQMEAADEDCMEWIEEMLNQEFESYPQVEYAGQLQRGMVVRLNHKKVMAWKKMWGNGL